MKPIKKICFLSGRHAALDDRIFYKEAVSLAAAGYDVHVIARTQDGSFLDMGGMRVGARGEDGTWAFRGVTFHGLEKRKGWWGKWREYRELVRMGTAMKADAYHCHEADFVLAAGVAIHRRAGGRAKLVYDMHEYWPGAFGVKWPGFLGTLVAWIIRLWEKRALRDCGLVITANAIVRGHALLLDRFRRTLILWNAPVLSLFRETYAHAPAWDGKLVRLCHEGGLGFSRGLANMVAAVKHNPGTGLYILGSLKGLEKAWLERQCAEDAALGGRIVVSGWVAYEEVGLHLAPGGIGLILFEPSANNMLAGPPNKLFNYMRYGMPVISVDLPETRAVIERYRCGIIIKGWDVGSIEAAVAYMASHPEEAEEMGRRGKRAVLDEFSWEHQGEALVKAYGEMFSPEAYVVP